MDYALRKINNVNRPFGGKLFLLIGDFYQCRPVNAKYLFQENHLFNVSNYFKVKLNLNESIRQHDKEFLENILLIRKGDLNINERKKVAEYFKDCQTDNEEDNSMHLFVTNNNMNNFIKRKLKTMM